MRNVTVKVEGSKLVLTCDLSVEGERSASGKTMVVASTEGNAKIGAVAGKEFYCGLNIYHK